MNIISDDVIIEKLTETFDAYFKENVLNKFNNDLNNDELLNTEYYKNYISSLEAVARASYWIGVKSSAALIADDLKDRT